ncbi:PRC-barrel domain-containing protein [Paraburkholderia sp. SOS3]|jgi:sporulation protein YlmC with PRC-barrel domain|uniref:PRC-barrel domain-containing protein n=1 Tax=Paraburkholderia sp. SOS3 TaxID=1926494 RepID=UPI0009476A3E|nr:PRC-barrel domain-containing protein [Paraburkholderia sp. SOS3]APR39728.1 photosystem reaction center subunit H [Paraburkholderia sp. SOS3]
MSTGANIVGSGRDMANGPGPEVMAAATLDGDRVISSDGHDIGKLKDIMLDVRSGRVAYAVLSTGGFLGIGDKLMAIPWGALTLDTDRTCFVLSLTAERVKNAPGFDRNHWPSMADETWATSIHQYYGREPYWGSDAGSRYRSTEFDARDAGDIPPGSSDAPEAGGVKL